MEAAIRISSFKYVFLIKRQSPWREIYFTAFLRNLSKILISYLISYNFWKYLRTYLFYRPIFVSTSEIRAKTNHKYLSKVNVRYKSQTLVSSLCFCSFPLYFLMCLKSNLSRQQYLVKSRLLSSEKTFVLSQTRFVLWWFLF